MPVKTQDKGFRPKEPQSGTPRMALPPRRPGGTLREQFQGGGERVRAAAAGGEGRVDSGAGRTGRGEDDQDDLVFMRVSLLIIDNMPS